MLRFTRILAPMVLGIMLHPCFRMSEIVEIPAGSAVKLWLIFLFPGILCSYLA